MLIEDFYKIRTIGMLIKYLGDYDLESPIEFSLNLNDDYYLNVTHFEDIFSYNPGGKSKRDTVVIYLGTKYKITDAPT